MSIPRDNYIGDPDYPAPWTTKKPREGLRDIDEARIVSLAPDVCLTPVGSSVVPIPYPVVDFCGHDKNYTPSVRFTGKKAMVMRSCTTHVHGDAPGVRKGVKSGTVESICEPIGHADHVRAEGSHVIRHLDRFWMNNRNTQGEAIFVRGTKTFDPPLDDDHVPGSLRAVEVADASRPENKATDTGGPGGTSLGFLAPGAARALSAVGGGGVGTATASSTAAASSGAGGAAAAAGGASLGTILAGIGVFAAGMLIPTNKMNFSDTVPQDEFEVELLRDAQKRINGLPFWDSGTNLRNQTIAKLQEHRRKKKAAESTDQSLAPVSPAETVRVDEEGSQRRCIVGPYSEIEPMCKGNAHHIVPDMAYRLGRRPTKSEFNSTANRIPNSPTLNQGMSICLLSRQHGSDAEGLHGQLRDKFSRMVSPVPGTAPMGAILRDSLRVIEDIPDLPPECKKLAKALATGQVMTNTGLAAPGRIKEKPLPNGEAEKVLRRGHY
ncbi:DUF4150 domain-containing protein [Agrobacterium sp. BA1120]|uniref:DUF4150 domain-containing protein n=1 Tax=Agrobacterium sp. BA1120 TaxID=3228927 RepID=UPI003369E9B9